MRRMCDHGEIGRVWNLHQPQRRFTIENKAAAAADIYLYDEISWFGITAADFVNELKGVTASAINVHINSPGGDAFDGIAILNSLRSHPATVTTVVEGLAASAASFIAMGGDVVTVADNSMVMIHDAFGLMYGNAADARDLASRLDQMSDNIAAIYAGKAGESVGYWRDQMKAETWFTAQEAVTARLADKIVGGGEVSNTLRDTSIFAHLRAASGDTDDEFDPAQFRELLKGSTV